jgi:Ca2+-binding RTX toxin-like protein
VLCVPPGEIAECLVIGMELTVEGASKFAGLQDLVENGFGKSLSDPAIPLIKGIGFMGGDILLGGKGNDTLEGKSGDDLIDGDLWLNVQLRATYNDPNFLCKDGVTRGVCLVDGPRELVDDVFSDPQRLNPGKIEIVRTIVDPYSDLAGVGIPRPAGDCAATNPVNCDTAVFNFPFAEYVITRNANGTTTVQHVPPLNRAPGLAEGTDILRHMEQARFLEADGTFRFVSLSAPLNSIATGTVTISDTTPTEDQVLTATASITDANGFNPALVTLEWQVETAVPGVFTAAAIGNSFAPGNPEVGHALRVAARFTDNAGFAESVLSTPTAPVANINNPPTGAPTLSTTAPQVAEALSVSPAGIVDLDGLVGVSFTFQWQQGAVGGGTPFSPIAGATAASFTPTPTQVNRPLRVRVFYTDNHGTAEAILSAATDVVGNVIVGTTGPDTLTGTDGRDNVQGLAGADTITTGLGDDVITGGPGDDTINAGGGNDTITGGNGDDTINAGPGDDVILVGLNDGFDDVGGGAGNDVIRATANNVVIGLRALAGVETITANGFTGVTIATPNTATTLDFTGMTLTGIVSINGGNGNDTITGSSGPDTIIGGGGDDTMDGGGGNNVFKFALQSGADRILNFKSNPGPAGGQDKLDISARGITAANFATRVTIVATGAGNANTQIRFTGTTDTITLVGVALATVTIADFTLAP